MNHIPKFLFTILLAMPLAGQAVVRQGTLTDLAHSVFTSPMVIELPLDRLKGDETGGIFPFTDQDKYECDDVTLKMILIKKSTRGGGAIVRLNIESSVFVRPSYDRKVSLHFSIISAGKTLEQTTDQEIAAKEKKLRSETSDLELSKEEFEGLFVGQPHGILKVVMTVAPDK